jgi:hypothetical protein
MISCFHSRFSSLRGFFALQELPFFPLPFEGPNLQDWMERRVPVKEAQRREEILNVNEPRGVPAPITKIGLPAAEAGTLIQEISGLMTILLI